MQEKVCLIIPCYNEAGRLDINRFKDFHENIFYIFVNDGSSDGTESLINKNLSENIFLLNLDRNSGKGEAVRQGMLYARSLSVYSEFEWIGFWDADLATPLTEIPMFLRYAKNHDTKIDSIWGSRIYKLGSNIERSFFRHIIGRIFATVISLVLGVKSYDSQCGAKLFKPDIIDVVFKEPFISKWIFDVEILKRLSGHAVIEYPVCIWSDVGGSKMNLKREVIRTLLDILRIRFRY